jgi:hypothetical protein
MEPSCTSSSTPTGCLAIYLPTVSASIIQGAGSRLWRQGCGMRYAGYASLQVQVVVEVLHCTRYSYGSNQVGRYCKYTW